MLLSSHLFAGTLADDLRKIGVTPTITKKTSAKIKNNEFAEDRYFLDIKFGKLTADQFKSLMKRYGNYSRVPYQANRVYDLIDFLPASMQGLVNKTFETSYYSVNSRNEEISFLFKNGVSVSSNCFNTTIEVIRSLESKSLELKHRFFIPDRWVVTDNFEDAEYGQYVAPSALKPYDVLFFLAKPMGSLTTIQHTAIYLSDDLVFEKTDSSSSDPYRISYTEDVKGKYRRVLPERFESSKVLNRRFLAAGKALFPDMKVGLKKDLFSEPAMIDKLPVAVKRMNLSVGCETALGGGCDLNFYDVKEVGFVINPQTGRAQASGVLDVVKRLKDL